MTKTGRVALLLVVLAAGGVIAAQPPADWPQFLGPDRTGVAREVIRPDATLSIAWRTELPAGRSGLVVVGDRIYTTGDDDEREFLFALDRATGRQIWRADLGAAHPTQDTSATPAVVGTTVVALTQSCVVHGVEAATGKPLWQRSLVDDFKSRLARNGCGMSPLIDGGNVVIPTGAPATGTTLVSFNAATGATVWAADTLPLSLSTPASVGEFGSERLLLYHHAQPPGTGGLTALRIAGGAPQVAWRIELPSNMSDTAALPLPGNRVLLQTWNDSSLIDASATPKILWSTKDLWALYSPPVHHQGTLYGWGGNSTEFFAAVDVATGRTAWTERIYRGYVANAGGTLVVLSEASGFLRLVAADPTRYRELTRLQVFRPGARTVVPPTVAGGRIYVRNLEEVVAVEVK